MDVRTVASVDLSDACYRLRCVTVEDWNNNSHIIIETWKALNILCNRFPNVTKGSLTRQEDHITTSPPQAVSRPYDSDCRAASLSSHVTPTCVSNTQPRSTPYDYGPVPGKGFNSTASKSCPQKFDRQRALKNIVYNAPRRQQLLEKSDVITTLSQRITKYPPARAGGDVARAKRHGLDRSMFFLEGFFGAMFITEKYREFQTSELQRRGKRNPGKPKNVYNEFATHLGVSGVNFAPITQLGDSLLAIWKSGRYAFLLLVDRRSTLRRMSVDDAESLGQSLCDNSAVKAIIQKHNISIKNAYDRYKQVADDSWTVEKMATTKKAIDAIMLVEDSNRDEAPGVADRSPLSGIATPLALDTASSCPTSVEDEEISTPATTPSEHPVSRQSSAPPLEPRNVESVRQVGGEDWISRGNLDGLPTMALRPQTLQEHGFSDSSTTITHKSSEVDSSANNATCLCVSNTLARKPLHADHQIDTLSPRSPEGSGNSSETDSLDQGPRQSENSPTYPNMPVDLAYGMWHLPKRPRLDHQTSAMALQGPGRSDSVDFLGANSFSEQGQYQLEDHVTAESDLAWNQSRLSRKRPTSHGVDEIMTDSRRTEYGLNDSHLATIVTSTDDLTQPPNYSQLPLETAGSSTTRSRFESASYLSVAPRPNENGIVQQDCSVPIPHDTASTFVRRLPDPNEINSTMVTTDTNLQWPSLDDMDMIHDFRQSDMDMIQFFLAQSSPPFDHNQQ
ncbi:hypothetical protein LTR67_006374 [Exophiala xenobiotica]